MSWEATGWAWKVKGLSATERLILLSLANFANRENECWPSVSSLMLDTGLSERTIRASTKSLEDRGLITKRPRKDGHGRTTSSVYYLAVEGAAIAPPPATIAPTRVQQLHPTPATVAPSYNEPVIDPFDMNLFEGRASAQPSAKRRASRLSEDWTPTERDTNEAFQMGLTIQEIDNEAAKFRDYWIAKSGKDATKLDWSATWRNWIRRVVESRGKGKVTAGQPIPFPNKQGLGGRAGAALRSLQERQGLDRGW